MTIASSAGPASRPQQRRYGTPATVRGAAALGKYPRLTEVQAVALALGYQESTAGQVMNPADPRFLWGKVAKANARLIDEGHVLRAHALTRPILVALRPKPLLISADAWDAAREHAQELDGREDVAEIFVRDRASYLTWRAAQLKSINAAFTAIAIGDPVFGVELPWC